MKFRYLLSGLLCLLISYGLKAQAQADSTFSPDDTAHLFYPVTDYEYIPDYSYEVIQERLSCIEKDVPLHYTDKVKAFIDYFTVRDRDYTKRIIQLKNVYFPLFEKYLKKYNMPDELKYLSIIESGLNPKAVSYAGAVGLWQFMPYTARMEFGLRENWYLDEKMDPEKATDAACQYLKFLYNYFDNDWELALAAYNTGPGNVRRAIRRSGYKKNFWQIYPYLSRQTRSYVPQYVAIDYVMHYLEEYNFKVRDLKFPVATDTLHVDNFFNLKAFAENSGICLNLLQELNPEIKRDALPAETQNYPLRIPADKKPFIQNHRDELMVASNQGQAYYERLARNTIGSTYGRQKLTYTVRSGDVLGILADRFNVRIADIRKWNHLRGNMIRVGQRLNIWIEDGFYDQVTQNLASKTHTSSAPIDPDAKTYTVQPGDTLWSISRRVDGLTVDKLKKLNQLTSNEIKPGQVLIIG